MKQAIIIVISVAIGAFGLHLKQVETAKTVVSDKQANVATMAKEIYLRRLAAFATREKVTTIDVLDEKRVAHQAAAAFFEGK